MKILDSIKNKIKEIFQKADKKVLMILAILMLAAFFVRSYNFSEWLLFRADQIRDVEVAKEAFDNGLGSLKLMGPKIEKVMLEDDTGEGDTLNMGPYYYYVQFLSMKIFNTADPWTAAVPDLVFSILAIPLFYLLLRKFFSKKISLVTTTVFSFSFLITQYSRFAWNPNQLFFWEILLVFSMLKASEKAKFSARWFLTSVFALLVISQLHFLAFSSFAVLFVFFYIFRRPQNIKLKHGIFAFLIFLLFYTPVFLSEIKNNADNAKRFVAGLSQKTSEETLAENITENIQKHDRFYLYFVMPIHDDEIDGIEKIGFVFIIFFLILLALSYWGKTKIFGENTKKSTFIFLALAYFFVFFIVFINVADRLEKPRYWLPITPLPFIFLAFGLKILDEKIKGKWIKNGSIAILLGSLLFWNFYGIYWWYASLKEGKKIEMPFRDPILRPHRDLITLGQMKRAVDVMAKKASKAKKPICYFSTEYQIKNGFEYLSNLMYPEIEIKKFDPGLEDQTDCEFFVISKSKENDEKVKEDISDIFEVKKIRRDGAIKLWELEARNRILNEASADESGKKNDSKVYYWKDL